MAPARFRGHTELSAQEALLAPCVLVRRQGALHRRFHYACGCGQSCGRQAHTTSRPNTIRRHYHSSPACQYIKPAPVPARSLTCNVYAYLCPHACHMHGRHCNVPQLFVFCKLPTLVCCWCVRVAGRSVRNPPGQPYVCADASPVRTCNCSFKSANMYDQLTSTQLAAQALPREYAHSNTRTLTHKQAMAKHARTRAPAHAHTHPRIHARSHFCTWPR